MKIYTITQERIDEAKSKDREYEIRGVTGPGKYTWNEQRDCYEPVAGADTESAAIFGIGGIGIARENETPHVPSERAFNRYMDALENARVCRRCRQSELDGAMFTTNPSSGYCDDCCG